MYVTRYNFVFVLGNIKLTQQYVHAYLMIMKEQKGFVEIKKINFSSMLLILNVRDKYKKKKKLSFKCTDYKK